MTVIIKKGQEVCIRSLESSLRVTNFCNQGLNFDGVVFPLFSITPSSCHNFHRVVIHDGERLKDQLWARGAGWWGGFLGVMNSVTYSSQQGAC